MCLKSNHLSSLDHKIVEEASDGLQKAKVAYKLNFCYCARFFRLNVTQINYYLRSKLSVVLVFGYIAFTMYLETTYI
jgi:hypothetical protein